MTPGQVLPGEGDVELNPGRPVTVLRVLNTGDRPVQVGSHYHFAVANDATDVDRQAAWGQRLGVPAGTAVRFEPGIDMEVSLVPLGGDRVCPACAVRSPACARAPPAGWTGPRRDLAVPGAVRTALRPDDR